ncbi:MAG: hypothetical protein IPN80_04410 [Flavobacterium sp.]|nr:hypothetical protein [Flavobacterium sp.]
MNKILFFGLLLFISCKKEMNVEDFKIEKPVNPFSEMCYQGVQGKDTVSMSLIIKGDQLQYGNLSYNCFEKDDNEGTLVGAFRGDTLKAKYSFQSEGTMSVREVIFLKQGKNYVEGHGPVLEDQDGKVVFKDYKEIQFESSFPLLEVPCKKEL